MSGVTYSPKAARALLRYRNRAAQIRAKIEQFAKDPAALANVVKSLKGSDAVRLRVGDFRVIMQVTRGGVRVLDIGPRGDIYD